MVDFGSIGSEHSGFAVEVQLTLNEKGSELFSVGAIKDIWLSDFGSVTRALIFSNSLGKVMNSVSEVWVIGV